MSEDGAALAPSGAAPNPLKAWFYANEGPAAYKWPHYFPVYHRHLARYRGTCPVVVEFGVSHGGSLRMWRDYFGPGCLVTGVDNDPRCAALELGDGITVITGDQEDRDFLAGLASQTGAPNVVIDDGGHSMAQQLATLEEMWPVLRDGGTFLTEDVHTSYGASWGGGYLRPGTLAERAKELIDRINAWHSQDPALCPDYWTRTVAGMHVYDSIIVLDKETRTEPLPPLMTGSLSF